MQTTKAFIFIFNLLPWQAVDDRTIGHNPERLSLLKGGVVYSNAVVWVFFWFVDMYFYLNLHLSFVAYYIFSLLTSPSSLSLNTHWLHLAYVHISFLFSFFDTFVYCFLLLVHVFKYFTKPLHLAEWINEILGTKLLEI